MLGQEEMHIYGLNFDLYESERGEKKNRKTNKALKKRKLVSCSCARYCTSTVHKPVSKSLKCRDRTGDGRKKGFGRSHANKTTLG